ncbi:MAG: formate dehydrogenase accessory sulfurtransferase FdhD [Paracoccus sp. (in: a-proteobacteria)]|nr:formate dehydrogenase accessory sulfurtransferase FdhD [Paracoccus sp. (in: a-proteobacteria)]
MEPVAAHSALSVTRGGASARRRELPEEVPVAMVFDGTTLAVMMATPADIADFAYGFALSEGVIDRLDQVAGFEIAEHEAGIEARFWLREDRAEALAARRRMLAGPVGCGLCGIDSIEQAMRPLPVVKARLTLCPSDVARATDLLRDWQPLHDQTRATHAAGFLTAQGVTCAREDVGRHNALDKLIGALARDGQKAAGGAFVMTSRLSVELVQKCAMAGCPALIAVSAPTAAAVRLAEGAGITLAAFARDGGFELFTHPNRFLSGIPDVA